MRALPQHEDYLTTRAWVAAMHEVQSRNPGELQELYNTARDDFIAIDNPTLEQGEWWQKFQQQYATACGILRSHLKQLERYLRKFPAHNL